MRYTKLAILTLSIGVGLVANAQQSHGTRPAANVAAGKQLFLQHCSACHGNDAKGRGSLYDPLSADKSVRVPPADLTVLTEKNGGTFPAARIMDAINSKVSIPGHGTPDMPAWGDIFYNQKANPKVLDARVRNLTAYIESIQTARK